MQDQVRHPDLILHRPRAPSPPLERVILVSFVNALFVAWPLVAMLPDRVRTDLVEARKAHDSRAVAALRELLAAFSNAEAPPAPATSSLEPTVIGLVEHERLALTEVDHRRILETQIETLREAADQYESLGQAEAAATVRYELAVLEQYS